MRFRANDELVCIVNGTWETVRERTHWLFFKRMVIEPRKGPKLHQVVTVVKTDGMGNLILKEFPRQDGRLCAYDEKCFQRLDDIGLAEVRKILKRKPFTR